MCNLSKEILETLRRLFVFNRFRDIVGLELLSYTPYSTLSEFEADTDGFMYFNRSCFNNDIIDYLKDCSTYFRECYNLRVGNAIPVVSQSRTDFARALIGYAVTWSSGNRKPWGATETKVYSFGELEVIERNTFDFSMVRDHDEVCLSMNSLNCKNLVVDFGTSRCLSEKMFSQCFSRVSNYIEGYTIAYFPVSKSKFHETIYSSYFKIPIEQKIVSNYIEEDLLV